MAIALDPAAVVSFVLEAERESKSPTVWSIKRLTVRDEERIGNAKMRASPDGGFVLCAGTEELETLRSGLCGVKDFADASGAPVPFQKDDNGFAADAFLNRIPKECRQEIAAEIRRLSTVSVDEKKP